MSEAALNVASLLTDRDASLFRSSRGLINGAIRSLSAGSSLELRDHRPYVPGDDIRSMDWKAVARTGQHIVRVFHEETRPVVDLILDISTSMTGFDRAKSLRAFEVIYFLLDITRSASSSLQVWVAREAGLSRLDVAELDNRTLSVARREGGLLDIGAIRFRSGSTKILVSDLLFAMEPATVLKKLGRNTIVIVPRIREEADPPWAGHLRLIDCESGFERPQTVTSPLLDLYRDAYARHFELWSREAERFGVIFVMIDCADSLEVTISRLVEHTRPL